MSDRLVFWDGAIRPVEDARVSVLDAGFLYGDGIYETMRAYSGTAFARELHLDRLARSAATVDLALPSRDSLRRAVDETLRANHADHAVVRVTVTRGRLERRLDLSSAPAPSLLVTCEPLDPGDDAVRAAGVRVIYSRYVRPSTAPLAGVKSTNYQVSLFARNEAREAGAREVLVPDERGDIVEAAAANVFLVEGGTLTTPPLTAGILGGITRELVLELAADLGIPTREETLNPDRVNVADELFLSGTTIQVTPVTAIGDAPVGSGQPGPVTLRLLKAYRGAVDADIARSASNERAQACDPQYSVVPVDVADMDNAVPQWHDALHLERDVPPRLAMSRPALQWVSGVAYRTAVSPDIARSAPAAPSDNSR